MRSAFHMRYQSKFLCLFDIDFVAFFAVFLQFFCSFFAVFSWFFDAFLPLIFNIVSSLFFLTKRCDFVHLYVIRHFFEKSDTKCIYIQTLISLIL